MATKNTAVGTPIIDFNGFRKERKRKVIVVDFGDERLEMPAQMPATVMLDLMAFNEEQKAAGKDGDFADMPPEMAFDMMAGLIGTDKMRAVAARQQMDIDELVWLLEQLMGHYMGDIAEQQSPNGAGRPVPASTSSKTGRSSKPISTPTTA